MKIISKYKDYYDYLIGVYGEDPLLMLDRRSYNKIEYYEDGIYLLNIGNVSLEGICQNNVFYWGRNLKKFHNELAVNYSSWRFSTFKHEQMSRKYDKSKHIIYTTLEHRGYTGRRNRIIECSRIIHKIPINRVIQDNIPISLYYINEPGVLLFRQNFPILENLNINKIYSPGDIWNLLSNYLSQQVTLKEPTVPIGDDKIRIQSHGFDLKNSFRLNIKD